MKIGEIFNFLRSFRGTNWLKMIEYNFHALRRVFGASSPSDSLARNR